jgi:hypothetical protein
LIHVVTLERRLVYHVRISETFEGEKEELTREEAIEAARDSADECVFLSYDDNEHESVTEGEWLLVHHNTEEEPDAGHGEG